MQIKTAIKTFSANAEMIIATVKSTDNIEKVSEYIYEIDINGKIILL